jgi:hydroxyacylglutathione hydrolase
VTIDPDNETLQQRVAEIKALRQADKPTVPSEIVLERATNPFLRAEDAHIQAHLNMQDAAAVDVFAEIRARKDSF